MTKPRDRIVLQDMDLPCRIGVAPGEDRTPQPLRVRLSVFLDLEIAARSGRLEDTVDYAALADEVRAVAREGVWTLLESLALAILRLALARSGVGEAEVEITKRRPPLGPAVGPITVCLRRRREELE